mmetsp:Transcript_22799/g.44279  ORF Transcript_22799/g.44279 Transcript_22799/m.44279 type:complete len:118 (-) Transcript_22799:171-524(-)
MVTGFALAAMSPTLLRHPPASSALGLELRAIAAPAVCQTACRRHPLVTAVLVELAVAAMALQSACHRAWVELTTEAVMCLQMVTALTVTTQRIPRQHLMVRTRVVALPACPATLPID